MWAWWDRWTMHADTHTHSSWAQPIDIPWQLKALCDETQQQHSTQTTAGHMTSEANSGWSKSNQMLLLNHYNEFLFSIDKHLMVLLLTPPLKRQNETFQIRIKWTNHNQSIKWLYQNAWWSERPRGSIQMNQ